MDKQQFATISIGIKSAYPASKILEDMASMDFWYMMLKDIPYEVAENAVMEHICTNVFPPNIAEIRKLCMERCRQPVPSFDEAWGVVQKAISTYGRERPQEVATPTALGIITPSAAITPPIGIPFPAWVSGIRQAH